MSSTDSPYLLADVSDDFSTSPPSVDLTQLLDVANYVDDFLYASHIVSALIGIPFNLLMAWIIIVLRRLHFPRNFTWIGIGISNVSILVAELLVDLSVHWKFSPSTRSLCICLVALFHCTQTVNFLLALLERHVSITYSMWHKRHVTIVRILVAQFGCSLLISLPLIVKNQMFGENIIFQLFSLWNFKMIGTFVLGLLPILLIAQLSIMQLKTQKVYPSSEAIQLRPRCSGEEQIPAENQSGSYFINIGENRVSQMELEAFKNVFLMGKIFLLFTILMLISFGFVAFCLQQSLATATLVLVGDAPPCSTTIQAFYYIAGSLNSIHSALVNPTILVYFSSDTISVWRSLRSRRSSARRQRVHILDM